MLEYQFLESKILKCNIYGFRLSRILYSRFLRASCILTYDILGFGLFSLPLNPVPVSAF